jgi:uncharacterized protein YdhG (YjbR/CyaY superfamily)
MKNYKAETVDNYITSAEPKARPTLEELRKLIKTTVPGAEESISWGIPFYKYHGLLAGFSAFTNHASFGLAFVLDGKVRESLERKGYSTGSKTVQIRFDQRVPATEIRQILKAKAKANEAK